MISFTLQNFILSSDEIPSTAKAVYMQLMARANEYRSCFPSVDTIAYYVGRSPRTVQRALKLLCEQGLIHKESRYRLNSSQTSNLYTLVEQSKVKTIMPKPPKKSFVPMAALPAPAAFAGVPEDVIIESVLDYADTTVKMGKKSGGICEVTHKPPVATDQSNYQLFYKIPQNEGACQAESVNKPLIISKAAVAVLFARYFIFAKIPYKEVYRIMTSPELQTEVYANAALNSTAKLVFVYMCAKADEHQRCIVSPAKLARRFARSKRTIQRALAALYEQELITAEDRENKSGAHTGQPHEIRRKIC